MTRSTTASPSADVILKPCPDNPATYQTLEDDDEEEELLLLL